MNPKSKSQLWEIHGKWYDLSKYMKRHPGGETIIKQTQGQGDISALFETYHAFSEIQSIYEILQKFEVEKSNILKEQEEEDSTSEQEQEEIDTVSDLSENSVIQPQPQQRQEHFEHQFQKIVESKSILSFSDSESEEELPVKIKSLPEKWGEFDFTSYRQLVQRIKCFFPDRNSIKAPKEWYLITIYIAILFLYTFSNALFTSNTFLQRFIIFPLPWVSIEEQAEQFRILLTLTASISWISLGFNVMHDASHYAIITNPTVNQWMAKVWNALNLWNSKIWFYHHVFHHHSFTGLLNRDPDISNYYPFGIKTPKDTSQQVWQWTRRNQNYFIPFLLFGFPGQSLGQAISYQIAAHRRTLWRMKLPDESKVIEFYDPLDLIGMFLTLAAFEVAVLRGNWFSVFLFLVSNNVFYALNVIFDHDSYENHVTNEYQGKDWLRLQIQHSSNFLNEDSLWTHLFGSINYQIEHHLFPNMSNYHYADIKPIVREFCREHNIPYNHHSTLRKAWDSFMRALALKKGT
jgi:fatty acid desaturase